MLDGLNVGFKTGICGGNGDVAGGNAGEFLVLDEPLDVLDELLLRYWQFFSCPARESLLTNFFVHESCRQ